MNLKITWKYLVALFALTLILMEVHEQVHINTGALICGGYGERDFNSWATINNCAMPAWSVLATVTGPLFSYALVWFGVWLLVKAKSENWKAIGFSLIFANVPFARIFTAVTGGGDETTVLRNLFKGEWSAAAIKYIGLAIVLACAVPPLYVALKSMKNRFRWLYLIGFSVLPLFVLAGYSLVFLNSLLAQGYLSSVLFLGTPTLIIVHTLLMVVLLAFTRKWLFTINRNAPDNAPSEPAALVFHPN